MKLTGEGGVTLYSQAADAGPAGATVCVRFYDFPESILNLTATPPQALGTASYSLDEWPAEPSPVSFNFDFRSGDDATISPGHRIGARIWVAGSSDVDLALLYDHPSFQSSIQLNSL